MAHIPPAPREEQWIDNPGHGPIGSSAISPTQQLVFQWVDAPRQPQYPPTPTMSAVSYAPPPFPQQQSPMALPQHRGGFDGANAAWGGQYDVGLGYEGMDPAMQPWANPHGCGGCQNDPYGQWGGDQRGKGGKQSAGASDHQGYGGHGQGQQQSFQGKGERRNQPRGDNGPPQHGRNQKGGCGGKAATPGMLNDGWRTGQARQHQAAGGPDDDVPLTSVLKSMGPKIVRDTLVSTLESIYKDRIKPLASYVKGRLKEKQVHESIVKNFVEVYSQNSDLFDVQKANSDDATIFLITQPAWFQGWVDMDSPEDPYDEGMWSAFAAFLEGMQAFAGGRYGMARDLSQRNLPFFAPYSLGEICHIVQLAIQHRKLIVYHRKMLKPIQTIMCQQPSANNSGGEDEIKDMDHLCLVLFRMLLRHPEGVQLSRLKQTIKHEFGCTISEISFLCTKLSDLFNREPLADTFKFQTEDGGKSMYVRLGNPTNFSDHVKQIFHNASAAEGR